MDLIYTILLQQKSIVQVMSHAEHVLPLTTAYCVVYRSSATSQRGKSVALCPASKRFTWKGCSKPCPIPARASALPPTQQQACDDSVLSYKLSMGRLQQTLPNVC